MLLMLVAAVIVGWFAAGTVWNVRRGNALVRWMQPALEQVGERSTLRWLGSTAVELKFNRAKAPFRSAAVVVFLEPRDMPWLWALSRRKDTLILRGELRREPGAELEALDLQSWSGREALRKAAELPVHHDGGAIAVWSSSDEELQRAAELLDIAARSGLPVRRLSLRRTSPHLQLHLEAPKGSEGSPAAVFEALRELAERA